MTPVEFFKLQAKNLLRDFKTQTKDDVKHGDIGGYQATLF